MNGTKCTVQSQHEMYCSFCYIFVMELKEQYERLAHARSQAGYSKATDAARAFGWNENTYRSHENGTRDISKAAAQKYGKAYKVDPSWLLFGKKGLEFSDQKMLELFQTLTPKDQREILKLIEIKLSDFEERKAR